MLSISHTLLYVVIAALSSSHFLRDDQLDTHPKSCKHCNLDYKRCWLFLLYNVTHILYYVYIIYYDISFCCCSRCSSFSSSSTRLHLGTNCWHFCVGFPFCVLWIHEIASPSLAWPWGCLEYGWISLNILWTICLGTKAETASLVPVELSCLCPRSRFQWLYVAGLR